MTYHMKYIVNQALRAKFTTQMKAYIISILMVYLTLTIDLVQTIYHLSHHIPPKSPHIYYTTLITILLIVCSLASGEHVLPAFFKRRHSGTLNWHYNLFAPVSNHSGQKGQYLPIDGTVPTVFIPCHGCGQNEEEVELDLMRSMDCVLNACIYDSSWTIHGWSNFTLRYMVTNINHFIPPALVHMGGNCSRQS